MPGFGSGSFGSQPFGQWGWSRRVLFEYIPDIYREQDAANGGLLEAFTEGLRPTFDALREKIRDFLDLRDPLFVRTQYDDVERLRLGPVIQPKGVIEQRGVTGTVDGLQQFNASNGRFRVTDVGKDLIVSGSIFPENNRIVSVVRAVSLTSVLTDPLLVTDSGPLRWELRTHVDPPEGYVTVEVRSGDLSDVAPSWSLFDGYANFTVVGRRQFKVPADERQHLTEQEGSDGIIDSSGRFRSPTVVLAQTDVGKHLTLSGSQFEGNNVKCEILAIVTISAGDLRVVLDADPVLQQDANLVWALLPFGELDLDGIAIPRGVVEQEGSDLQVTAVASGVATIATSSALFTSADVGKELLVRGSQTSPANDGVYVVASVSSSSSATVTTPGTLIVETSNTLTWELRTATQVGDFTQVDASASSIIANLAPDFGIEIDTQDSASRQRSWVRNVSQWLDYKGTPDGYRILGEISGFNITASQLFRIDPELFSLIPDDAAFEVGEVGPGRFGSDGTVSQTTGLTYRLDAPSAAFVQTDVGKQVRLRNAAVGGNNELLTIDSVLSATALLFTISASFALPDANNGSLQWAVVRLYTNLPPLLPLYDEIDNDLLEAIVETTSGSFFTYRADKYEWEDDFSSTVDICVIASTTIAPGVQQVHVVGSAFPVAPEVILRAGHWEFLSFVIPDTISGGGGSFSGSAPDMVLTRDPSEGDPFTPDLVGRWILIALATTPSNSGVFQITAVLDGNSIVLSNGLGVAEAFSGYFQILAETDYPVETVPVLLQEITDNYLSSSGTGDSFTQSGNVTTLADSAGSFTSAMVGQHLLLAGATSTTNNGIFVISAFVNSTHVKFKNPLGVAESFGGTWRVGRGTYTFDIASAVAPFVPTAFFMGLLAGAAKFRYDCPTTLTCGYCGASRVFALIEATPELLAEGGLAVERGLDRVISRLADVTPAHADLIVRYQVESTASLTLSATVEP